MVFYSKMFTHKKYFTFDDYLLDQMNSIIENM